MGFRTCLDGIKKSNYRLFPCRKPNLDSLAILLTQLPWLNNIEKNVSEMSYEEMNWIEQAQERAVSWALVAPDEY